MKRSRSALAGFLGSIRIQSKYSSTRISTAESDPPGCPDLAAPVISMISRRTRFAISWSSAIDLDMETSLFYLADRSFSNADQKGNNCEAGCVRTAGGGHQMFCDRCGTRLSENQR